MQIEAPATEAVAMVVMGTVGTPAADATVTPTASAAEAGQAETRAVEKRQHLWTDY